LKSWKSKLLLIALVLGLILPAGAYAANSAREFAAGSPEFRAGRGQFANIHRGFSAPDMMGARPGCDWFGNRGTIQGVHCQNYLLLLAEKYTPESLSQWQDTLVQRTAITEEFKQLRSSDEFEQKRTAWRDSNWEKAQEIRDKVQNGEITREEAAALLKEWRTQNQPDWKEAAPEDIKQDLEARQELRNEFTQAVKSGDNEKIKAVLPKLLAEYKAANQSLAAQLEELKAGLAAE